MRLTRRFAFGAALLLVAAACGGDDDDGGGQAADPNVVTIATSEALIGPVDSLADGFREANPDVPVEIDVRDQEGMADAFDADSPPNVLLLARQWIPGDYSGPSEFLGRNLAIIIVPPGNPAGVSDVTAFDQSSDLRTRVCGPDSPFGNLILPVLVTAGVTPADDAVGNDCEADAADAVAAGDLDAALVFRTQLGPRPDVEVVDVPEEINLEFEIRYVVLDETPRASAFVEFIQSAEGQSRLTEAGLLP